MENQEIILGKESILREEATLSPEKEQEYISKISELEEENADLRQQLALMKKALYGQKSEKTEVIMEKAEQLTLFNEAEDNTGEKIIEKEDKIAVVTHERRKHSTHADSFENLEIEEVICKAEDKVCPECGSEMKVIGREFVRDELVYVPARMFVRKIYIEKTRLRLRLFPEASVPRSCWQIYCIQNMYRLCRFTVRKRIMQPAVQS